MIETQRGATSLRGEVAVVTGASSGIGAATARELARRGAVVVLAARRKDALDAIAGEICSTGALALAVPTDLTSPGQVGQLVDQSLGQFSRIDILVNNAGANWLRPVVATPPEEIADLVALNLLGAMQLTRAVLPGMLERRHGAIISICSLSGRVAMEPIYSATKYGLRGFSLALRRQLVDCGVSVSLVSPGNIRTAMTSHLSARMPEPELVAKTVANLVRFPRREVVVPRQHYAIAWLEQLLPGVADVVYQRRHWSPVRDEEGALWTS